MASVTLTGLRKTHPGAVAPVLKGIDLVIADGTLTVLVGPSGCGKSTLLRTIAGLEQPDAGEIYIGSRLMTKASPRDRDVAMVFQSYALYPHLTVRDNLAFGLRLRGTSETNIRERIAEVAPQLGLESLLDRLPRALSGGQRQRVAMGRAIVRRPALFLFDEPLSNLDAALRSQVRVEIRRLHDRLGATMVYVTHDQVEAMTLADHLVVLNGGVIEQEGPPLEVYHHPRTRFVAGFLGTPPMNFFDAVIEVDHDRFHARTKGVNLVIDGRYLGVDESAAGEDARLNTQFLERAVVVGVRPQDVRLAQGEHCAIDLPYELVETLGFEAHVHGVVGGTGTTPPSPFIARVEGSAVQSMQRRGSMRLDVSPEHVHLFDPQTGAVLRRGAERK
ncbi:MAG: ABC transporter ATP-binding protein [Polyangiales bacterium]